MSVQPAVDTPDDPPAAVRRALQRLRAGGHRVTGARRAVIEVLAEAAGGHPSAEQLCGRVSERYPAVHRATVYRTLERLASLGVITHVHVGGAATTYHLAGAAGRHEHLHASCRACGRIIDLPGDLLEPVRERLAAENAFDLEPPHVALSGTCHACR
ncbi:Fur family ferric uptake transcriptional regulator [Haloactinopolyspora alba]|uniref:Fur family ferric uptake transcriptional regulator n=1 Tax=Haloactinopolyspora alba TaxID=648780 RepID=A0A2P8EFF8_9ACTN|nr:Fur family transcriptional regulator [Haloactinopolyspora alba]PSL08217.1 Fur family ferric uptake transcriptional regulator [Haloactinopolyspora alba]